MAGRWQFFVDDRAWDGNRRLFVLMSQPGGATRWFVQPFTLEASTPGERREQATLEEFREEQQDGVGDVTGFLQAALDAAWDLGMRPKAYADHTNELKAVRYHLEDMRALVLAPPPVINLRGPSDPA